MANAEHVALLKQGVGVWNEWRGEHPKVVPQLSHADLRMANLIEVDLSEACLIEANLSGADLHSAKLQSAILNSAHLTGAIMTRADLRKAQLQNASLSFANLTWVDLGSADITGAHLFETVFANTNLKDADGLDACLHLGPSVVDLRTMHKSGHLPLSFLQGVGLPDKLIKCLPSLLNEPIQFYSCFISYSHDDISFARRIHEQLQERGIRCWLDEHEVLPGDDLYDQIERGIRVWDKVLLCCSSASLNSPWVHREIDKALQKEEKLWRARGHKVQAIIPLNLDGTLFEWRDGKASTLTSRLAPDFTGWETDSAKFQAQFERVLGALRTDKGGRETPPEPRL